MPRLAAAALAAALLLPAALPVARFVDVAGEAGLYLAVVEER